jgi:hypothetical protein
MVNNLSDQFRINRQNFILYSDLMSKRFFSSTKYKHMSSMKSEKDELFKLRR